MHFQAQWESAMVISACFPPSSALSSTPSTLDHNWRLLVPVKRVLSGNIKNKLTTSFERNIGIYCVSTAINIVVVIFFLLIVLCREISSTCWVPGQVPYHRLQNKLSSLLPLAVQLLCTKKEKQHQKGTNINRYIYNTTANDEAAFMSAICDEATLATDMKEVLCCV